jgi:hypothetical protein
MWISLGNSRRYLGEGHTHILSLLLCITSHHLCVPLKLTVTMEWTHLPRCEHHSGFGTKLNICVGCEGYITPADISHFCLFREIEYELDGTFFTPCENQYHPECINVGKPFKTRLVRATLGLQYPPTMTRFPFICEACTVRAVLVRELTWTSGDIQLLMLKRMLLVDMAHAWASSTLQGTARYLDQLSNFRQKYVIDLFPKAPITQLPRSGVHSFALRRFRVHSLDVPKDGRRDQIQQGQKPPVSSLTCAGIEIVMLLVLPICHIRTVLLPPLAINAC